MYVYTYVGKCHFNTCSIDNVHSYCFFLSKWRCIYKPSDWDLHTINNKLISSHHTCWHLPTMWYIRCIRAFSTSICAHAALGSMHLSWVLCIKTSHISLCSCLLVGFVYLVMKITNRVSLDKQAFGVRGIIMKSGHRWVDQIVGRHSICDPHTPRASLLVW